MKISIATSYRDRKSQLYETLKSIKRTEYDDYEVVVADDCSSEEHRLDDLTEEFPFLKIIRMEDYTEDRWYNNPCIPFNKAIWETTGDILIIQNPECLHVHDIISFVSKNVNDRNYITFAAYNLDEKKSKELKGRNKSMDNVINFYNELPQHKANGRDMCGYYNHSKYRKTYYHFCSAITSDNMNKLNGFDERYANGHAFDDDELLHRIRVLELDVTIEDNYAVIHQFHKNILEDAENLGKLININRNLLNNKTKKESKYRVN